MDAPQDNKEVTRAAGRGVSGPEQIREGPHIQPDVDIIDRLQEIVIRADMPGVAPGGIEARFDNGILSLSGRQKTTAQGKREVIDQEYEPTDFYREFAIGEGIDEGKVSAEYEAGVLTLTLPKAPSAKPRRIEIRRK